MSLLGVDVGTSGCKAAVFSEDGRMLALAYEEYDYQCPQPGWAELDSLQIWNTVKRTIGRAVAWAQADPVKAVCVSSLGESLVPVTAGRAILGPALLNFDVRGEEYLDEFHGLILPERLYRINGNTLGNQFSLTKLKWLKQHQPDLYRQTDIFLPWSGLVAFMLGAEPRADYSLANRTLLFDLERQGLVGRVAGPGGPGSGETACRASLRGGDRFGGRRNCGGTGAAGRHSHRQRRARPVLQWDWVRCAGPGTGHVWHGHLSMPDAGF